MIMNINKLFRVGKQSKIIDDAIFFLSFAFLSFEILGKAGKEILCSL